MSVFAQYPIEIMGVMFGIILTIFRFNILDFKYGKAKELK